MRSFVAAGSGEAREGGPSYERRIIRRGDQSPEAMREKACFVLQAMEQRMAALGFGWTDVTATQAYTRRMGERMTYRSFLPLPCSTRMSIRSRSISVSLSDTTSEARRPVA